MRRKMTNTHPPGWIGGGGFKGLLRWLILSVQCKTHSRHSAKSKYCPHTRVRYYVRMNASSCAGPRLFGRRPTTVRSSAPPAYSDWRSDSSRNVSRVPCSARRALALLVVLALPRTNTFCSADSGANFSDGPFSAAFVPPSSAAPRIFVRQRPSLATPRVFVALTVSTGDKSEDAMDDAALGVEKLDGISGLCSVTVRRRANAKAEWGTPQLCGEAGHHPMPGIPPNGAPTASAPAAKLQSLDS